MDSPKHVSATGTVIFYSTTELMSRYELHALLVKELAIVTQTLLLQEVV